MDRLANEGEAELFKGGVHLTLFGFAMMCLAYNAMAFSQRRHDWRLAMNAAVYGALVAFEVQQIQRHLS